MVSGPWADFTWKHRGGLWLAAFSETMEHLMSTRILCATDGSEHSDQAVAFAADFAKQAGAELIYLTVNAELLARGARTLLLNHTEVQKVLASAFATAKKVSVKNIKCVDLSARDVAGAVVTYAEKNGVDHIIVGSGGKTASSRLLIGSVSNDVVNKAHCPVTVVR
jgi:nucleotide-binding universal stress UspA family protein